MKRLTGILLVFVLASVACSYLPGLETSGSNLPIVTVTVPAIPSLQPATLAPTSIPASPVPTIAKTQAPITVPALTDKQVRNATLSITGSDQVARIISFKDGKFIQGTDPNQTGYVSINIGDQMAFGDLNGDGLQDAVVSLAENYGGTGVFVSILSILNDNGQPGRVSTAPIEDRAKLNELKIESGEILVDAIVHGPADPMCCATQATTRAYRLIENKLVLAHLSTKTQDSSDRVIQIDAPSNDAEISGPFVIKGSVSISPFENSLVYKVFRQNESEPIDQAGFMVSGDGLGGPGTFELALDLHKKGFTGPLRIEILDTSAADGSTLALATLFILSK